MEGRLFSSFEDAWAAFLSREEPLEDFVGSLPVEESFLSVWHAPPGEPAAAEAAAVQAGLAGLPDLRLTPGHWLHVSLAVGSVADAVSVGERLRGFGSFEATYGPVNCFHEALVLEARSERFAELVRAVDPGRDLTFFLPHLSVAYVDGTPAPAPFRERMLPLRDRPPIRDRVSQVALCVVPIARDLVLSSWRTVATVPL